MRALVDNPYAPMNHVPVPVRPGTLRMPARPPKLVYLDLNHWIGLAKADAAKPDGEQFKDVLSECIDAVARGTALFPISDSIFMEIAKIGSYRQRHDLREVIERVSRYLVVTSRVVVADHEIEGLLDRLVGPSSNPINEMDYLDWGVGRAFGLVGGFRIRTKDTDEDVTERARLEFAEGTDAFDRRMALAELELNRRIIDGPTRDEEPKLRADGWDPKAAYAVAGRRAQQERDEVAILDANPAWRRGRLRDVIAAREIIIELNQALWRGLNSRGATLEGVFPNVEATREAFDSMPSFDVSVTLKTAYHRNPQHPWAPNHIQDIDALSSTVPYCDIVVTDAEAAGHLIRAAVPQRMGTIVLSRLPDLRLHL